MVPCLVEADGELIAGHGRILAAANNVNEIPVTDLGHLTATQRRAYRFADNTLRPVRSTAVFRKGKGGSV